MTTRTTAAIIAIAFGMFNLMAIRQVSAATIVNGDFSSPFDAGDDGPDVLILEGTAARWHGDSGSTKADWIISAGAADLGTESSAGGTTTRSLVQTIADNNAITGVAQLDFSVRITGLTGSAEEDLNLYVIGWNSGGTSPTVDLSQSNDLTGTSLALGSAISLLSGSELKIVENGVINAALTGVDQDALFDNVSVDVDFGGAGYEFYAVLFEGEPGDNNAVFQIDNISIAQEEAEGDGGANLVPEPSSYLLALLAISSLFILQRHSRA